MTTIGGKHKTLKPSKPQFVVQKALGVNEFAKLEYEEGQFFINWVGDPNAATKFDSKYAAKTRVRELADVPETRCFKSLD